MTDALNGRRYWMEINTFPHNIMNTGQLTLIIKDLEQMKREDQVSLGGCQTFNALVSVFGETASIYERL